MNWKGHFLLFTIMMIGLHYFDVLAWNWIMFLVGAFTLSLPDIDLKLRPLMKHRGFTHSLGFLFLLLIVGYLITRETVIYIDVMVGITLGWFSHMFGDSV